MSRASSIQARVAAGLLKVGPMARTAYKRTVVQTGGDPSIGRPGTTTTTDTLYSPQPVYSRVDTKTVMLNQDVQYTGTAMLAIGDYKFTFAGGTVTSADFEDPTMLIVLKDSKGNVEAFRILDYQTPMMGGLEIVIIVYVRSVSR